MQFNILTEAPQIVLSDDHLNNPDKIDLRQITQDAIKRDEHQKELSLKNKKIEELRTKYEKLVTQFLSVNTSLTFEEMMDSIPEGFVPYSGMCETIGGEILRAIYRLVYRWYNDGDKFFEGYGIETCASSAEYLFDNVPECASIIQSTLDEAKQEANMGDGMSDDTYEDRLQTCCLSAIKYLQTNSDLFYETNDIDSREYSTAYVKENQPMYSFELYASDSLSELIDAGLIDSWTLQDYVRDELSWHSALDGFELERPWGHHDTTVLVTNLTKNGYEYLMDSTFRDVDSFWESLVQEYASDFDEEEDSFDDEVDDEE